MPAVTAAPTESLTRSTLYRLRWRNDLDRILRESAEFDEVAALVLSPVAEDTCETSSTTKAWFRDGTRPFL